MKNVWKTSSFRMKIAEVKDFSKESYDFSRRMAKKKSDIKRSLTGKEKARKKHLEELTKDYCVLVARGIGITKLEKM